MLTDPHFQCAGSIDVHDDATGQRRDVDQAQLPWLQKVVEHGLSAAQTSGWTRRRYSSRSAAAGAPAKPAATQTITSRPGLGLDGGEIETPGDRGVSSRAG
jgi:hypothetical protein